MATAPPRSLCIGFCRAQAGDEDRHDLVALATKPFDTAGAIDSEVFAPTEVPAFSSSLHMILSASSVAGRSRNSSIK